MTRCRNSLSRTIEFSPFEWLDRMARVSAYLAAQYHPFMTRDEAIAHFQARKILSHLRLEMLDAFDAALHEELPEAAHGTL